MTERTGQVVSIGRNRSIQVGTARREGLIEFLERTEGPVMFDEYQDQHFYNAKAIPEPDEMRCRYCNFQIVWMETQGWVIKTPLMPFGKHGTSLCRLRPETEGGGSAGHRLIEET